MQSATTCFRSSIIHFIHAGHGSKVAICFHGYGESGQSFEFLSHYLQPESYTIIAIDLPFHGQTLWKEGLNFTESDLRQIIRQILQQLMPQISNYKLTLMGFSLGGRAALSLFQIIPEQIEKIILMAPDGLKVNSWYWLATQTWLGNKFFGLTMKHPGWFLGFLKLLNKMGLINASIFKFITYYIGDDEVRKLLYQRWTTLRKLKPDLTRIKSLIQKNNIPVRLLYGKHDRIILSSIGENFKKGIEEQCELTVIHSGHQVLHEKHAEEILPAILH
jgi:pimeloyl-ACP methyl ester carboxylesterase